MRPVDWWIVAMYIAFALSAGVILARRGGASVGEFFLSGRRLPWWLAGTSIVATTFAIDTPLVISGWVRDFGIWKNWLWWCYALTSLVTGFVFARLWRRGEVMTKAEFAELRYGDSGARWLRGFLGILHAGFVDVIQMCWILLAATKIVDVLFGVDKTLGLAVACVIALAYSLMAGLWGVVVTDLVQFAISMVGAIVLAVLAWQAVGGAGAVAEAVATGALAPERLAFLPRPGPGGPLDAGFWTTPVALLAVYLGVAWFAVESADGAPLTVQRVSATRDERQGTLAVVWFAVANNALRPWPWILVAVASLLVLPHLEVTAPMDGTVAAVSEESILLRPAGVGHRPTVAVPLAVDGTAEDWRAVARVGIGAEVAAGEVVARSDSERAYVVMLKRYLPAGLLGLVAASLLAAFMSTIDTLINVAASFFVNDVYRRFLRPGASERHYVLVARLASVAVLAAAAVVASTAQSISALFTLFISFLAGVGPVYVLRWFWWRVTAWAEIAAMTTSAVATLTLTWLPIQWPSSPLSPEGALLHEGRLLLVVGASLAAAMATIALTPAPDPARLVRFFERLRPPGAWGPVRALASVEGADYALGASLAGVASGVALVFGLLFGLGHLLLGRPGPALALGVVAALGLAGVRRSLRALT